MADNNTFLKTIRRTVLECDTVTVTGRTYELEETKESLKNNTELHKKLESKSLFGEWHNAGKMPSDEMDITKVAFVISKLYWYKNELRAVIDILDTPYGRFLLEHLENTRFATLGTADIIENNIVHDFKLNRILAIDNKRAFAYIE